MTVDSLHLFSLPLSLRSVHVRVVILVPARLDISGPHAAVHEPPRQYYSTVVLVFVLGYDWEHSRVDVSRPALREEWSEVDFWFHTVLAVPVNPLEG